MHFDPFWRVVGKIAGTDPKSRGRPGAGFTRRQPLVQYADFAVIPLGTGMRPSQAALGGGEFQIQRLGPERVGSHPADVYPERFRDLLDGVLVQIDPHADANGGIERPSRAFIGLAIVKARRNFRAAAPCTQSFVDGGGFVVLGADEAVSSVSVNGMNWPQASQAAVYMDIDLAVLGRPVSRTPVGGDRLVVLARDPPDAVLRARKGRAAIQIVQHLNIAARAHGEVIGATSGPRQQIQVLGQLGGLLIRSGKSPGVRSSGYG